MIRNCFFTVGSIKAKTNKEYKIIYSFKRGTVMLNQYWNKFSTRFCITSKENNILFLKTINSYLITPNSYLKTQISKLNGCNCVSVKQGSRRKCISLTFNISFFIIFLKLIFQWIRRVFADLFYEIFKQRMQHMPCGIAMGWWR